MILLMYFLLDLQMYKHFKFGTKKEIDSNHFKKEEEWDRINALN